MGTGYRKEFGTDKSFDKLKECFSPDTVNDTCDENDELSREPDSPIDFEFFGKLELSSIKVGILFASYKGKMAQFKRFLKQKNRPFHLLYNVGSKDKRLFYLSFDRIENSKLLVGKHPFYRQDKMTQCSTKCNRGRVDFLDKCFSGKLPGYLKSLQVHYPNKPILPKYLDCPDNTFPPRPNVPSNLSYLSVGVSEINYYRNLKKCWQHNNVPVVSKIPNNVGIKMKINLTVLPANPKQFNQLPEEVRKMLASLAKMEVDEYVQSVTRTIQATFLNCK